MFNLKRHLTTALPVVIVLALLPSFGLHLYFTPRRLDRFFVPSTTNLEIRLEGKSILNEGLGAIVQGLKPVLLLANATGAVITAHDKILGHGYHLKKYLRLSSFIRGNRILCNASRSISNLLHRIVNECERFPYHELPRIFTNCNMIVVTKYLVHPRPCLFRTAPLVRAMMRFSRKKTKRNDICVLRRGGDVEKKIMKGFSN